MSTFAVEVLPIDAITSHPNADRLEIVTVKGWQCVVSKGTFKAGDLCVYIPIDSVLPQPVLDMVFAAGSKIVPTSRVRTIKLRGAISQGIAVKPYTVGIGFLEAESAALYGTNVAEQLGITKYEPPAPGFMGNIPTGRLGRPGRSQVNPHFRKYTGIENAKNYPRLFTDGEPVVVTEKIHGTNFRAGYVPFHADTWWKKVKRFFGVAPKWEFVFGSHNVQLQGRGRWKGFYKDNVYAEAVEKYHLRDVLKPGEVVYGEVYGASIQKGYMYGCAEGERRLALFDVMIDGEWLDPVSFQHWADARQLPMVPVLYKGPFNWQTIRALTVGDSVLAKQKVREGVVCKSLVEATTYAGRKVLKFISDAYLLGDQTDFH